MIDNVKNKVGNIFRNIYTSVVPLPKDSKFYETGILTPEEFVAAGDQLTQVCPSWTWKPAVSKNLENPAFPPEKQFLQSQSRSMKRVKDLYGAEAATEKEIEDEWVITESANKAIVQPLQENILEKIKVNDHFKIQEEGNASSSEKQEEESKVESNDIIKVSQSDMDLMRIYSISITYDFYYLTPRFWLSGLEESVPLSGKDIFQDIMAEYANKTVTEEDHPYLGVKQVSIHPCKHPNVLKYLTDMKRENGGGEVGVHQALFLFLKFMASVMPTMEYDYTVDIDLA